jgi:3-hydroxy-9,10-secoandrosta-1,3,5(10)-triene-9,17-dione monooxygenase reductase component
MIDATTFRSVLGSYPTGVCAVTAIGANAAPLGMIVGSFSSVSLDPPLIGFFPDKRSGSWPMIAATGRFCVNVLASDQLEVCKQLATPGSEKFKGLSHGTSGNGSPLIDGAIAWIDCDLHTVADAGDHVLVLGLVKALEASKDADPMLFFKGRYGGFAQLI